MAHRWALSIVFLSSGFCIGQVTPKSQTPAPSEIELAARSPEALARYLQSSSSVDWTALQNILKFQAPLPKPPCDEFCSVEIVRVDKPPQAILVVRGNTLYSEEYLRYIRTAQGNWQFAGATNSLSRYSPSQYKIARFGGLPFLTITSDYSQNGFSTQQLFQVWFDLSLSDFDPVFDLTVDGGQWRWGFGVGRTVSTSLDFLRLPDADRINVKLAVRFDGVGFEQDAQYLGVFERSRGQKKFEIRSAYADWGGKLRISNQEFEELANPFSEISNETLLRYALPGLKKIAIGTDKDAKDWLRSILSYSTDTPEKSDLLNLLNRR